MEPTDTDTMARGRPPGCAVADGHAAGFDPETETWPAEDCGLIDLAATSLVSENRARAARLEAISRFHERRVAEAEAHGSGQPGFFVLTPLEATKAEFGPLLCIGEGALAADLDLTNDLKRWFPNLWRSCRAGRLDLGRARVAHDQLANLTTDEDKAEYAKLVEEFLDAKDDPAAPIHPVDRTSLQRAARRKCLRFPQKSAEQSYAELYRKRRVSLRTDETGIATLSCRTAVTDAMTADYRLTLIAKKRREMEGEERTIEQLRVDTLIDLIHGRLRVAATDGELEDDATADGSDPDSTFTWKDSVGSFARPIINVTVPITTLMGVSDEPGVHAGGESVPADLTRQLAQDPSSTWYRLLTDPFGGFLELSTKSYAPTGPIWCTAVAMNITCVWPGCLRPATIIPLDHRVPFPLGKTSTLNLQPLCERHHKVKHSQGFEVVREADGSVTWTSRFGSTFRTPAQDYPLVEWPAEGVVETDVDPELDLSGAGAAHKDGADRWSQSAGVVGLGSLMELEFRAWMERNSATTC